MTMKRFTDSVRAMLGSRKFFYAVVALLVLQAGWIALTGRYPMAYDEQNHLGVVKLYAEHPLPFWSEQPPGPAPFSSVSRDPSYLYHWLMSLPYHLFNLFLHDDESMVLAYRLISIGLFAAGVVLYRRLLLMTGASPAIVHSVLALFVLIPTVPFLAGQMNYDNLLFTLTAGMLLLTANIVGAIRDGRLDARRLLLFTGMAMLGGIVKFPFLAIALAMAIWIVVVYCRTRGRKGLRALPRSFAASFGKLSKAARIGLVVLVLLAGVLFAERYGGNTVRYGTPIPECDQVLDVDRCWAFGPWRRNYQIYQSKLEGTLPPVKVDVFHFTYDEWLKLITWQYFYTLDGPQGGFEVGQPTPWPYRLGLFLLSLGTVLTFVFRRHVFRRPLMRGLVFVAMFYVVVLWMQNLSDFFRLHLATAIQARYIVLVLPILLLALALAFAAALRRAPQAKAWMAVVVLAVFLTQGGGIAVYLLRSDPDWWRPHPGVVRVNQAAQDFTEWMVIDDRRTDAPKKSYPVSEAN